jgi:hypothetical protein
MLSNCYDYTLSKCLALRLTRPKLLSADCQRLHRLDGPENAAPMNLVGPCPPCPIVGMLLIVDARRTGQET